LFAEGLSSRLAVITHFAHDVIASAYGLGLWLGLGLLFTLDLGGFAGPVRGAFDGARVGFFGANGDFFGLELPLGLSALERRLRQLVFWGLNLTLLGFFIMKR
jgi:hypothetical protein